jgi:hypothetical protein
MDYFIIMAWGPWALDWAARKSWIAFTPSGGVRSSAAMTDVRYEKTKIRTYTGWTKRDEFPVS